MVVKIVNPEPDPYVVKHAICDNCGVKLEYVPADVKSSTHRDYGGGSDTYRSIVCPKCSHQVSVRG
jgi:DNA-directed RNA polymerase subunit RPC12/RpoP